MVGVLPFVEGPQDLEEMRLHPGKERVLARIEYLQRIAGSAEHAALLSHALRHLDPMRLSRQSAVLRQIMTADTADADRTSFGSWIPTEHEQKA